MKHREAYTGQGGQNMSPTNLGKAVRCLMAVLLVAHAFALLACTDDQAKQVRNLNNTPVVCNTGNIAAVTGVGLTFSPANVFDTRFPASVSSVTFTFTAANAFSLTSTNGGPAAGTNGAFGGGGAFTMTYTSSSYTSTGATQGPLAGQTNAFTACNILVTAGGVEVGDGRVVGTVQVQLTSARGNLVSQIIIAEVRIAADGTLIIVNPGTGADVLTNVNVVTNTGLAGVS
jgi:hypothetical protein